MNYEPRVMESKEGIDALFMYATEGILVTDDQGVITRVNPNACRLFGYDSSELVGQHVEVLVPKRFSDQHTHHRKAYTDVPHARAMGAGMNLHGLKKDGTEVPVEISLSPYKNADGNFVIAFIVDITQRKLTEAKLKHYSAELERQVKNRTLILEEAIQELERTKKELHNALEKERELNEMKSRFVSIASHEFRTPLTTMLSSLSLIAKYNEQQDHENHGRHVRKIKNSINNLTDILNDFLSVSKLEEGKVENNPEELYLESFIAELISEMQTLTAGKQTIHQEHTGSEVALLDPKLLKHILVNLISNAIKFSPEKSDILIRSEVKGTSVIIVVKDSGIGISAEDQKHLFERFFRGHNAMHIQGTGLGLSIVARYVELMNGTLRIESLEGQGTQITILFPQKL
jgi:PAS domain S-box-containing protein